MTCKGCGEDNKFIKAHVIPESFFRELKDGDKAPRIHSTEDGEYPKKHRCNGPSLLASLMMIR